MALKNRYRTTYKDGRIVDVDSNSYEHAISKSKRFVGTDEDPTCELTHEYHKGVAKTPEEMDAIEQAHKDDIARRRAAGEI